MPSSDKRLKTLFKSALRFHEKKDYKRALKKCDQVIALDQSKSKVHHLRAEIQNRLENFEEAEKSYKAAMDIDPNSAYLNNKYAALLLYLGKLETGLEIVEKTIKLCRHGQNKDSLLASKILKCSYLCVLKRYEDCLQVQCEQPNEQVDLSVIDYKSKSLYELRRFEEAISYLEKATGRYNDDIQSQITFEDRMSRCLMQLDRYNDALPILDRLLVAIKLFEYIPGRTPHDSIRRMHATCLYHLGRFKEAHIKFLQCRQKVVRFEEITGSFERARNKFMVATEYRAPALSLDYHIAMCEIGFQDYKNALIRMNHLISHDSITSKNRFCSRSRGY